MKNTTDIEKIKVWQRGQITIPNKLRKQLQIQDNSIIYAERLGKGIFLRPSESAIMKIQKKGEELMKKNHLKIKDLIDETD
jgi:AbrB family looped-hinge helix DNA binding protein